MRKRSCCRVFSAVSLLGGIAQNGKSGAESKSEGAEAAGTRVSVFQRFHSEWGTLCALLRCGTCWACGEPPGRWTGRLHLVGAVQPCCLGFSQSGCPVRGGRVVLFLYMLYDLWVLRGSPGSQRFLLDGSARDWSSVLPGHPGFTLKWNSGVGMSWEQEDECRPGREGAWTVSGNRPAASVALPACPPAGAPEQTGKRPQVQRCPGF